MVSGDLGCSATGSLVGVVSVGFTPPGIRLTVLGVGVLGVGLGFATSPRLFDVDLFTICQLP